MSTVALDWGDGSPVENLTISGTVTSWTLPGRAHTYASPGNHTITLTGLSGGSDTEIANTPDAPQFAGPVVTGTTGSTAGSTVTVAKPTGVVNGDTLVACLRGQTAAAAEFICGGWRRLGPDYDATNTSGPRLTTIFIKPIVDAAAEPANYVFTRSTSERKDAIVFRVTGAGAAQPVGRDTVVGGSGSQGSGVTRHTGPYPISNAPALKIFAGGQEVTSPNSDVPTVTPADITQRGFISSDPSTGVSRTALWVGTGVQTVSPVPQQDYACLSTSSGLASVALRPPMPHLFPNVAAMLAKPGFTWAHRGNSTTYAELSANAYANAAARGYSCLEFSLTRTSDGVWFGLHDDDINRTSGLTPGTQPPANTMTWAQIQTFNNVTAADLIPRPYLRWEDFRDAYPNHILILDPKGTWVTGNAAIRNEFWAICAQIGVSRCIVKGFIDTASLATGASSRGYTSWGFGYAADIANSNFANYASLWSTLGLEYYSSPANWTTVLAFGKPVIAHIANVVADYKAGMALGAAGVQCGGSAVIPAVNALT